jgi:hypothetical protein
MVAGVELSGRSMRSRMVRLVLKDDNGPSVCLSSSKIPEEACKLLEAGFEYVTELDEHKLFRNRK